MIQHHDFAIASGGTVSDYKHTPGYRLAALQVPTIDSSTITFKAGAAADGTGAQAIHSNTPGAASAALTLGTADTGAKFAPVPAAIGEAFAFCHVAIVVATQSGGARTIRGWFVKMPQ